MDCPTCGHTSISAPYRTDSVVYMACDECSAVWPVEVPASKKVGGELADRQKREHSNFIDLK
jgi:hypothetical protein